MKVWYLKLYLRGLLEPLIYTAHSDDTARLENRMRLSPPAPGFFCFDDGRGTSVCVHLAHLQAAQAFWEPVSASAPAPDPGHEPLESDAVRVYLAGREEALVFSVDEEETMAFCALLEGGHVEGEFLEWLDADGEQVWVGLDDLMVMEYPTRWDEEQSKIMEEESARMDALDAAERIIRKDGEDEAPLF